MEKPDFLKSPQLRTLRRALGVVAISAALGGELGLGASIATEDPIGGDRPAPLVAPAPERPNPETGTEGQIILVPGGPHQVAELPK